MKPFVKPLAIAAVIASSALWAQAQTPPAQAPMQGYGMGHHGRMDPTRIHDRMAARLAALKAKLTLNAAQEAAWNDYMAAMQPPPDGMMAKKSRDERRRMFEEYRAMTTPQRLDKMAAMKAEHDAQMNRRHQATRNFYDTLNAAQQKVFDANTMMGAAQGRAAGMGGYRHHH